MNKMKNKFNKIYWTIFSILLISVAIIQYYGLIEYHYVVPAGDDPFNHYLTAKSYFDGTSTFSDTWKAGGYPPLYHIAMAKFAHLFNADLLQVINWTYPSIIILASLSIFVATYFLFGPWQALIAFFLYAFTGASNMQLLFDGGYPNLTAAHIFLPLFILFYIKLSTADRFKHQIYWLIVSLIFAFLIIFTHHISTFYLFGVIGSSLPFILIWKWVTKKWKVVKGILWSAFLVILYYLVFYSFFNTKLLQPIKTLYLYSSTNFDPAGYWSLRHYPEGIGVIIFTAGVLGLIVLTINLVGFKNKQSVTTVVLGCWTLLLLIGSRLHMANPERFARDLIVPLSICSGFALVWLWQKFNKLPVRLGIVIVLMIMIFNPIKGRFQRAIDYEPMVRITQADLNAINTIKSMCKTGIITTNAQHPWFNYFLSDYTLFNNVGPLLTENQMNRTDFIYSITYQKGWPPQPVVEYSNIDKKYFNLISIFNSPTNRIELYKVAEL